MYYSNMVPWLELRNSMKSFVMLGFPLLELLVVWFIVLPEF